MTEVVALRNEYRETLAPIAHADGWSRIQTVSKTEAPEFYRLLQNIGTRTGFPIVLNTSLNGPSQPIVERPREAFEFLLPITPAAIVEIK